VLNTVKLFRRGRLRGEKARSLLIELFDHHYQWPLRLPIIELLERGDPLRFLCTLRFLVDRTGDGVHLLNRRLPPERTPWFDNDLQTTAAALERRPTDLAGRLMSIMRLEDPAGSELEMRRLLSDIISMTQEEKQRGRKDGEQPLVPWLSRIADLQPRRAVPEMAAADQADLRRTAQRAVRIVWRLPGSRLATLTGSVASGYADVTSDIDISLFGLKLPKEDVRRSLIAATASAPKDITQLTKKTHAADAFWLEGTSAGSRPYLIDVRYFLIEEAQRLIQDPVPKSRADEELLADLSTAEVLVDYEFRGPDLLQSLQQATRRARADRSARGSAEIQRALADLAAGRDSAAMFYATTSAILALFQLLAARNDRWIVLPKRTADWLSDLEQVPPDLHQRLSSVALLPFFPENRSAKLETLKALEREISEL
jgi:hypothetical protein